MWRWNVPKKLQGEFDLDLRASSNGRILETKKATGLPLVAKWDPAVHNFSQSGQNMPPWPISILENKNASSWIRFASLLQSISTQHCDKGGIAAHIHYSFTKMMRMEITNFYRKGTLKK